MRILFAIALVVFPVTAQQRSPGAYNENGNLVIVMPPFANGSAVRANVEHNDDFVNNALPKALCANVTVVNELIRSSGDLTIAASRLSRLQSCEASQNYTGATRSVELVTPVNEQMFRQRPRSAFAVNTSPFVRGGFAGQLDTLASQAGQPRYQNLLRNNSGLSSGQAEEVIGMLRSKQCALTELPSGTYLAVNYGVAVSGRNLQYVQRPGDPAVMVAQCDLSDGAIIYIGEFCSNVYFPLQSVVYAFSPLRAPPPAPVAVAPPQVPRSTNLRIMKTVRNVSDSGRHASRIYADNGDELMYRIVVYNVGRVPARNVRLSDSLPSGVRLLMRHGYRAVHALGDIAPGDSANVEFPVAFRPSNQDTVMNVANVVADNAPLVADTAVVQKVQKRANYTPLYVIVGAGVACLITHVVHIPPCGKSKPKAGNKPVGGGPIVRPSVTGPNMALMATYGEPQGPPMFLQQPSRGVMTPSGGVDFNASFRANIPLIRISINTSKLTSILLDN